MARIDYPEVPAFLDHERFDTMRKNWKYSAACLAKVNAALDDSIGKQYPNISVAVAGSFGRMEAAPNASDFDYLVLARDNEMQSTATVVEEIRRIASDLKLNLPNSNGAFAKQTAMEHLLTKTGSVEDDLWTTAKRLLLLMECKPVLNKDRFIGFVDEILDYYLDLLKKESSKEPVFLLNDIIRYFREICLHYESNFWKEHEKWAIRHVKLNHSRVIMYSGLLFLVLNASKASHFQDKAGYLKEMIFLTPLEKIISVYKDNGDFSYEYLLDIYNVFLSRMSDTSVREQLQADHTERFSNQWYSYFRVTGKALRKELHRFLDSRRGVWSDNILEYLVF